jgi:hypothetical protein
VKIRAVLAAASVALVLAGCSFQNKNEREADKITHAVLNNDLAPVKSDIAPGTKVSRVQVAAWSDELNQQGKYISLKERSACDPGWHCFDVKFEKHNYVERMRLDENGKVTNWSFHMAE